MYIPRLDVRLPGSKFDFTAWNYQGILEEMRLQGEFQVKRRLEALKLIEENDNLSYTSIIFNPEIYWPIIGFSVLLIISFLIRKKIFKK